MTRAPKVGDYVLRNSYGRVDGRRSGGAIYRVERTTASTAWLVREDVGPDDTYGATPQVIVKARRSSYNSDAWRDIGVYVDKAAIARRRAARSAADAWRNAAPVKPYGVAFLHEFKAEQAEENAAKWTAVAAWLRAKPPADDLLITVEAS